MKIRNVRWWIAGVLFLLSVINYVDRQTLSILVPTIQADLELSDQQYGNIVSLFLAAYTVSYLVSGRLVDALGARLGLALFAGFWSLAQMATGLANSVLTLGACRFLLGLGEAGGYTASPKIVAEWFPPKDRGLAVGLYGSGAAIGATLAPLLVVGVAAQFGWRSAFVVTGVLGLLLAGAWYLWYREPGELACLTEEERETILAARHAEAVAAPAQPLSEWFRWRAILTNPGIWALMVARLLTDPVWYFFQFWMPKYLHTERAFTQGELASMWLIFVAADVGFFVSGIVAGALIRRGQAPRTARLWVMLGSAVLVPLAPLIAGASTSAGVFGLAMVVVLAHTAWLVSISTYVLDYVPQPLLGTAFGFIAAGSAVGGILMNQAVVWTIANLSYAYCFYAMVALHPVALLLVWRYTRRSWSLAPTRATHDLCPPISCAARKRGEE